MSGRPQVPSRWDTNRAKKRRDPEKPERTCLQCGADTGARVAYCSDACALAARRPGDDDEQGVLL